MEIGGWVLAFALMMFVLGSALLGVW